MKKLLIAGIIAFGLSDAHAEFMRPRDTVGKSSYTGVEMVNTALSTAPSFVRSVTFSGVDACTVSFINAQLFTANVATAAKVYFPGGPAAAPVTVGVDTFNSSGTLVHKAGLCHACLNWDWIIRPSYLNPLNEGN